METIDTLREAIHSVFAAWEKLPRLPSDWNIVSVQDVQQDRLTLQHVSSANNRYDARRLAYLEIRDGKIWILTDNTEEGIASVLVAEGVSKDRIVLGFYSPLFAKWENLPSPESVQEFCSKGSLHALRPCDAAEAIGSRAPSRRVGRMRARRVFYAAGKRGQRFGGPSAWRGGAKTVYAVSAIRCNGFSPLAGIETPEDWILKGRLTR